jgi:hypothetical protein
MSKGIKSSDAVRICVANGETIFTDGQLDLRTAGWYRSHLLVARNWRKRVTMCRSLSGPN